MAKGKKNIFEDSPVPTFEQSAFKFYRGQKMTFVDPKFYYVTKVGKQLHPFTFSYEYREGIGPIIEVFTQALELYKAKFDQSYKSYDIHLEYLGTKYQIKVSFEGRFVMNESKPHSVYITIL